jgi:hypothetical protein
MICFRNISVDALHTGDTEDNNNNNNNNGIINTSINNNTLKALLTNTDNMCFSFSSPRVGLPTVRNTDLRPETLGKFFGGLMEENRLIAAERTSGQSVV